MWRERVWSWLKRDEHWLEALLLGLAALYTVYFVALQLPGVTDPLRIEWDTRVGCLPAFRYHGTGLFPHDVLVDRALAQCPYLWRGLFWIGTLVAEPYLLTKVISFALLGVLIWQGFAFGRHFGGAVLGAAVVVLLLHCTFIWDRTVGATARSFGYPLTIAFLRYASCKQERRALAMLFLQAVSYPSAFAVCAPAYGLTLLYPFRFDARLWRFVAVALAGAALVWMFGFRIDPHIGHPITYEEVLALPQRTSGGLYPLQPRIDSIQDALQNSFYKTWHGPALLMDHWGLRSGGLIAWAFVAMLFTRAGRRLRELPLIFPALLITSLAVFSVAHSYAYRLYFPNRILQFSLLPLVLLSLPVIAVLGFRLTPRRSAMAGAALVVGFQLLFYGDGLEPQINLKRDFGTERSPVVGFVGGLPKDVLIAGHPRISSSVQVIAHRQVLFSEISNISHYYPHALEMQARGDAYYSAYYARDVEAVKQFRDRFHVDYLIGDTRDFGPTALQRSGWTEPFTSLAASLIQQGPVEQLYFGHPPPEAIVFRDGTTWLLDLRRLL